MNAQNPTNVDDFQTFRFGSSTDRNLYSVKLNNKWGFFDDVSKKVIIPIQYDRVGVFKDNDLCWVVLNGKWGYIDLKGKEVTPLKYDFVDYFSNGFAIVNIGGRESDGWAIGGKFGYIDLNGKEVVPPKYDYANNFIGSERIVAVKLNGKWGFIELGTWREIAIRYEEAASFSYGLGTVKNGGKWGVIDTEGKEIFPCSSTRKPVFGSNGKAGVEVDGRLFYINTQGNEIE